VDLDLAAGLPICADIIDPARFAVRDNQGMKMRAIAVWMCAAAGMSAQSGMPGQAAAPVVNLNVVAKDARGQPVMDLTREDFQVFEGSKAQRLVSFRRAETIAKRGMRAEPNEYSNRAGVAMSRVTVILFDLLNARFEDRGYMMNQLPPALQHVETSETLFLYILTMNGTLYAVHGLADANTGPGKTAGAHPWTEDIKALLDDASRETLRLRPIWIDVDTRVRMTYQALESLADQVAAAPGRKSLIWISHGVPIGLGPQVDYTLQLRHLTTILDRAEVAVYPVRQLESLAPGAMGSDASAAARQSAPAADGPGITLSTEDTLEQFAELTGGHAFMTPDIRGAIERAASDARMSYLISYEPPPENWDGKYHKIRVTCARKGVKVETKQGYYAYADQAAEGDREKAALETATGSAFDTTEIGVNARLMMYDPATHEADLAIRVDAADVSLAKAGEVSTGHLAVSVAGYLKDGRMEMFPLEEVAPRLTAEQRETALREGIRVERRLVLAEDVEKLRVLVYDRESGAVGSLTIPLERR
jgi:VWFA-related protein